MFLVMIGLSGLGLLSALAMKDLALTTKRNEEWGLTEREPGVDPGTLKGQQKGSFPASVV